MMFKNTGVRIQLEGGLGNQLFQYAAACAVSKSAENLYIETQKIGKFGTNHGVSILEFNLPGQFVSKKWRSAYIYKLSIRIINKVRRSSRAINRILNLVTSSYHAQEIGYSPEVLNLSKCRTLNGYFQSFKYPDAQTIVNLKRLQLKLPSNNYDSWKFRLITEDPIVLHVRRGDYENLKDSFGLLDLSYYLRALNLFEQEQSRIRIWIFSDSINEVKNEFEELNVHSVTWVGKESELTTAETLLLMSHAKRMVIGNSTFSWWAAYIGNEKEVIAPSKWYKNMTDPKFLIPPNWKTISSSWCGLN